MAALGAAALVVLLLFPRCALADTRVLPGMPMYRWHVGCSPTAGGMVIGYWNDLDRFPFYYGDASVWDAGTQEMVEDIADFMGTNPSTGGTSAGGMINGLAAFAASDNPDTPEFCESVEATITTSWYRFGNDDVWADYIAELEAHRPAMVNLSRSGGGHSVAGYGYLDNPGTSNDYFAVMDTWAPGLSSQGPPGAYIDGNGVEWWPWRPYDGTYNSTYDWRVDFQIALDAIPAAEPTTLVLLFTGGTMLLLRRRRPRRSG